MAISTLANVAASASSVTLFAANAERVSARLVNESTATLYLKEGATASTTSYSELVPPGASWSLDVDDDELYKGIITGIWTNDNGTARCTERTVA